MNRKVIKSYDKRSIINIKLFLRLKPRIKIMTTILCLNTSLSDNKKVRLKKMPGKNPPTKDLIFKKIILILIIFKNHHQIYSFVTAF